MCKDEFPIFFKGIGLNCITYVRLKIHWFIIVPVCSYVTCLHRNITYSKVCICNKISIGKFKRIASRLFLGNINDDRLFNNFHTGFFIFFHKKGIGFLKIKLFFFNHISQICIRFCHFVWRKFISQFFCRSNLGSCLGVCRGLGFVQQHRQRKQTVFNFPFAQADFRQRVGTGQVSDLIHQPNDRLRRWCFALNCGQTVWRAHQEIIFTKEIAPIIAQFQQIAQTQTALLNIAIEEQARARPAHQQSAGMSHLCQIQGPIAQNANHHCR